jgi:hypothetical protein
MVLPQGDEGLVLLTTALFVLVFGGTRRRSNGISTQVAGEDELSQVPSHVFPDISLRLMDERPKGGTEVELHLRFDEMESNGQQRTFLSKSFSIARTSLETTPLRRISEGC